MSVHEDSRGASEDERNPLTAPPEDEQIETGLDGEWSAGLSERSGRRGAAQAYKSAAQLRLEDKLYKYKWAAIVFAFCTCCLAIIIIIAAAFAAGEHHSPKRHRGRTVTLEMMEEAKLAEMHMAGQVQAIQLRHQDDLCHGEGFLDSAQAEVCTSKGGICVQNEDDCRGSRGEGGVLKGTCGHGCGCCFSGCPAQWIGDGECDFACNTEEYGWDGNDCRGVAPLFSECPRAWLGDNECDDLCNNELNDFDGGDCLNVTMTEPDVPIETDLNGNGIRPGDERDDRPVVGAFNVCPGEWIGDGKCDVVCNVTRYNYDCNQEGQCDCQPDDVKGVIAAMPQADIGPAASCSAGSNFAPYERHCVAVGGRCTGKDGECNGVIRGKCGPDCYCCIGRSCDDVGDETYVGDGVCDDACNTEDYEYDGGDCKGSNEAAFRSHDAVCPVAWKGDGHCDIECSTPTNDWDGGDCEDEICHGLTSCMPANICPEEWVGDGECDRVCHSREHEYDRGDCDCVDMNPACREKVAQGRWSCETMLCTDMDADGQPRCSKPGLCQLSCAEFRHDSTCTDERTQQELAGGGGFDNRHLDQSEIERARNSQCPAAIFNPSPMASYCERHGGQCMENKAACTGLLRGTCGPSCGCCYPDLEAACEMFAGDGQCDPLCNTDSHHYDGRDFDSLHNKGDCASDAQFQACPRDWIGDGECDEECNNEENDYDYPDCTPTSPAGIPFCPDSWKADSECDDVCNSEANNWDDGDCPTPTSRVQSQHQGLEPILGHWNPRAPHGRRVPTALQNGHSGVLGSLFSSSSSTGRGRGTKWPRSGSGTEDTGGASGGHGGVG